MGLVEGEVASITGAARGQGRSHDLRLAIDIVSATALTVTVDGAAAWS